ncbi:hypothetical protein HPB47_005273 [Ixodes persulcatus]|uniref:Uncharacterized protein n=1 Tax=Ixodes persulcatus TaxID=34615 RepID=A0AC60PEM3_IXOPE|nr:hypothetical protein HPB47_005273 [Ixodes persulcatus]
MHMINTVRKRPTTLTAKAERAALLARASSSSAIRLHLNAPQNKHTRDSQVLVIKQNYSLFKAESIQLKILGLRPTPRWKGLYTVWPVGLLVEHGVGPEDVLLQGWEQGDPEGGQLHGQEWALDPEGGAAAGVGCCVDSEGVQLRGQEKGAEAEGVPLRGWEKQGMELPLTQDQGTGLMLEHTEKVETY